MPSRPGQRRRHPRQLRGAAGVAVAERGPDELGELDLAGLDLGLEVRPAGGGAHEPGPGRAGGPRWAAGAARACRSWRASASCRRCP
eukprot:7814672-Lingulodinium_polyedra.AAC.1